MGETIFIDYKSGLDPVIFMQYSTPSGDRLIHQSTVSVNPPQLVVWGLHKFAPWHERFNQASQTQVIGPIQLRPICFISNCMKLSVYLSFLTNLESPLLLYIR